jgi:diguanylate cyclase (GGDEF)-like protein
VSSRDLLGRGARSEHAQEHEPPSPPARPLAPYPPPAGHQDGGRGSGIRRRRTALLLAVIGLTPLVAVALLTTAIGGSAITGQVNARLSGASGQAAAYLEQVIRGRVAALDAVANQLPVLATAEGSPSADPSTATADLTALIHAETASEGVVLTNAAGVTLLHAGSQDPLPALPPGWRASALRDGFLAAAVPVSFAAPAVAVAVPVLEGGGAAGGYLVEDYGLSGAVASLEPFAGSQGMGLLVLDRTGGLVMGVEPSVSGDAQLITSWTPQPALTSQADVALSGRSVELDDNGPSGPAAYSPVVNAPWVIRAALPGSALAAVSNLRIAVFSICGALALLFLAAVNMVNRQLHRQEQTEAALIVQSAVMEHAAMHDPLTGLPNRLLFNDRLQHGISNARRSGRPLALFVLDIDGFKALNDALGHTAGDAVLKETAARLQASVRVSDTVARVGGDEFVIVAVDADPADAELIGAKVRQRMEEPMLFDERPIPVGLSIGLAAFPEDGGEPSQLLRRADTNMYREKRARKAASG